MAAYPAGECLGAEFAIGNDAEAKIAGRVVGHEPIAVERQEDFDRQQGGGQVIAQEEFVVGKPVAVAA